MKPIPRPALALRALVCTTVVSRVVVRRVNPVTLTKWLFAALARRAARQALLGRTRSRTAPQRGRFTSADVDRMLGEAWAWYDREARRLTPQPTIGSRLNLRLACLTVGLFRAVLGAGTERAYAVELVADTTWNVYRLWGWPGKLRAGIHPAAALTRQRNRNPVALRFPFNPPGYLAKPVPLRHGLGFDMVRCAVAAYFREQGAVDLCLSAWCNLDFALGDMVGLQLIRTQTLVTGDDHCDFRWFATRRPRSLAQPRSPTVDAIGAQPATGDPS